MTTYLITKIYKDKDERVLILADETGVQTDRTVTKKALKHYKEGDVVVIPDGENPKVFGATYEAEKRLATKFSLYVYRHFCVKQIEKEEEAAKKEFLKKKRAKK